MTLLSHRDLCMHTYYCSALAWLTLWRQVAVLSYPEGVLYENQVNYSTKLNKFVTSAI